MQRAIYSQSKGLTADVTTKAQHTKPIAKGIIKLSETQVNIGSVYKVTKSFGKYFKEGERVYAGFYGKLQFVRLDEEDRQADTFFYLPKRAIKLIDEGVLVEEVRA